MEEQGIIKTKDVPNWGQTVNSIIFIFSTKISTTVIPLPQPLHENKIACCRVSGVLNDFLNGGV